MLYEIIKRPIVTEKSSLQRAHNKYVFIVNKNANKDEIRKAVQQAFNVTVTGVNVVNIKGKKRSYGRLKGKTKDFKKAVITVKEGQVIEALSA